LALLAAAIALPADAPPIAKTVPLFLGMFPLVNAWFDYGSYAATLTLVVWGTRANGWGAALYGALDVIVALLLFSLLGATLTAIVALLIATSRRTSTRWRRSSQGPRGDPQYFWLYGMIFSTFVHFSIASLSLISVVPRTWRQWLWDIYTTPADNWLSHAFGCVGIGLLATLAAGLLPAAV
jgi:hypothetical protein